MSLTLEEIRELAKLGIESEIARLQGLLSQLESAAGTSPITLDAAKIEGGNPGLKRHRRPMTAVEKKALGIRMKAIWAAKRKAAKATASA